MRVCRSSPPTLLTMLALLLVIASPLRAQDDDGREDAAADPPAAVPKTADEARRLPLPLPAAESTDEWFAFSKGLADEMLATDRVPDAIEEYFACAALHRDDLDIVADAAVIAIDYAGSVAHGLEKESPHLAATNKLVALGLERGGRGDPRLAYVVGRLWLVQGQPHVAFERFQESLAAGYEMDRLRPWLYAAAVARSPDLLRQGRGDEVVRMLEAMVAEVPDHPDRVAAKTFLAVAYRAVDDQKAADRLLDELMRDHPGDHGVWAAVGDARLAEGRPEDALAAFQEALSLAQGDRPAYTAALASVALVLHRLDRDDESEEAVRAFLELERDSAEGLLLLARIQRERGQTLEALRLLRRADRISRGAPPVLELLEAVHRERGETDEADAVKARLDALRKPPPDEDGESGGNGY